MEAMIGVPLFTPEKSGFVSFVADGGDFRVDFHPPYFCMIGRTYAYVEIDGRPSLWEVTDADDAMGTLTLGEEADRSPAGGMQ